ncbi:MAG TPA: hypothetical protein P5567_10940 [Kiritimatiellia bacterium]|nr:hypothetical protein [Kiritimatiellia bacterium]HSA18434.1 hypothetical protein [Kiritimatiellia bacterium]
MNVLLIQPPEAAPAVPTRSLPRTAQRVARPPWDLMCLQAYLSQRSRHVADVVDARFFSTLEPELLAAARRVPSPRVAILYTETEGLGQAMGVLDTLKRAFPTLPVGLCGPHPSQFPEAAIRLPRVDFVLAGDPEPILHSLLDYFTVETRIQHVPGLLLPGAPPKKAHWLPDLNSLTLPDWHDAFLAAYAGAPGSGGCVAELRLSRGHTGCPADRAFGLAGEPLRLWRMDRLAACIQRASDKGVAEVFLADPPGVWTPARLDQWCEALVQTRNVIPWSLQLLPTFLSPDAIYQMARTLCRRVVFLLPSCERNNLLQYGCTLDAPGLARTFEDLREAGIEPQVESWMGGPEEPPGAGRRIVRMLGDLKFPPFTLRAFPCRLDAPICREVQADGPPPLAAWTSWAGDPWNRPRPQAVWGGSEYITRLDAEMQTVLRTVENHPVRIVRQGWEALRTGQFLKLVAQGMRLRT